MTISTPQNYLPQTIPATYNDHVSHMQWSPHGPNRTTLCKWRVGPYWPQTITTVTISSTDNDNIGYTQSIHKARVHIVGQRANRYIVAFHIVISRYHRIFTGSLQRQAASRPASAVQSSVQCYPPPMFDAYRLRPTLTTVGGPQ